MRICNVRRGLWATLILPVVLAGCSDFIAPPESDPNAVPEATTNQLFVAHQAKQYLWHGGTPSRFISIWMQQMAGTARQHATIELYTVTEGDFEDWWEDPYQGGGLIDLRRARAFAEERSDRVYSGILKIHEAFIMGMLASHQGDIPFTEAANPEINEPALDEQMSVYSSVLTLLDQAIGDLQSGQGAGPGVNDFQYGGDPTSWIRAANSLKARFNLHLVEVDGNSRYQAAIAAAQQGISDISGNWRERHTTSATENNNWFNWEARRGGDIRSNAFIITMLNGGTPGDFSDDDPRLSKYFVLASGDFAGTFTGSTTGGPAGDPRVSASWLNLPAKDDYDQPILTCSETQFIIAEAESALGNDAGARTAAKAAIDCEEDYWDIDLSDVKAAFDAAGGAALFALIMTEKYIAQFLEQDIWNDYKRTCLPARTPAPGSAQIIARALYGQQGRQTNSNIPPPEQQPVRNDNDPAGC